MNVINAFRGIAQAAMLTKAIPFDIADAKVFAVPTTHKNWRIPVEPEFYWAREDDNYPALQAVDIELHQWAYDDHYICTMGMDAETKTVCYHKINPIFENRHFHN